MNAPIEIVSTFGYDMKTIGIDMWYGDTLKDCDRFTWSFADCDCEYRGNLYKGDRIVGDFHSPTLEDLVDMWNKAHTD